MEWISIEEGMPPANEIALLYAPATISTGRQFHIGCWDADGEVWVSQGGHVKSTRNWFTHWMSLPLPPQDGKVNISKNELEQLCNAIALRAAKEVRESLEAELLLQQSHDTVWFCARCAGWDEEDDDC